MTKPIALTLLALLFSAPAFTQDEQEQSECFFLDRECIGKEKIKQRKAERERQETIRREKYLQEKSQRDAERTEQVRLMVEQSAQRSAEERAAKQAKEQEDRRVSDLKYQQMKAEQDKQQAVDERAEAIAQKRRDAAIAELKGKCGADYKTPSIGMKIERVQECVAPVKLVSQLNRADGVVDTYRAGSLSIHAMSGRVVAWDR